eukprot:CAMPEP_0113639936 /NCGR_PEP_ID=MMETSP0017_2-20120614/20958_1 /TAXON_ID=2856 /ORGANISM="Cylindrotheca closterium" /LENGTH=486 /DNA_ID=CAMNT_0000551189 /DNA_START=46 /DNA_END=1506 /DNA_ORIENTATION=+ /assembly_acc=CAM_ASM_000147
MNIVPSVNDVLLGRGAGRYRRDGNKRWSVRIRETFNDFDAAGKDDKADVVHRLVLEVPALDPPGRFLRKHNGLWYALNLNNESDMKELMKKARIDYGNEKSKRKKADGIDEVQKCLDVVNDLTAKLEKARANLEKARQEHQSDSAQGDGSDEEQDGANLEVGAENKAPPLEDMIGEHGVKELNAAMQKPVQDGGNPKAAVEDEDHAPQDVLPLLPPLEPPRFGDHRAVKSMVGFNGLDGTDMEAVQDAGNVARLGDPPTFFEEEDAATALLGSLATMSISEPSVDHKKLRGLSYEAQQAASKLAREDGEKTMKISEISGKSVPKFKTITDLPKLEIVKNYRIKDDRYYNGSILEGEPHGKGEMVYDKGEAKGKILCGDWCHGVFQGEGLAIFPNGHKCIGSFHKKRIHGVATYITKSYIYVGEYYKNNKQGQGILEDYTRGTFKGRFVNGIFEKGSHTSMAGTTTVGVFKDWKCIKEESVEEKKSD